MKTVIHLHLPTLADHFRHRHPAPGAVAARRRGNAAGVHGGRARYGKRERQKNRLEERAARTLLPENS